MYLNTLRTFVILFLGLLVSTSAIAGELWDQQALLWKVSKPGVTNHVLGTMHSEDSRIAILPEETQKVFDAADTVALEVDMSKMMEQMQVIMLKPGESLKNMIPAGTYKKVMLACADFGLPEMICERFTPWGLALTLSMPKPKTGLVLDTLLYQQAMIQNKTVIGLETAAQAVEVFTNMSKKDHIYFLEETLKELNNKEAMIEKMTVLYMNKDLPGINELATSEMAKIDSKLARTIVDGLIDKRNARFVENAEKSLAAGNLFLAVGAMHLPGENGVLSLLQKAGWKVEPAL